MWIEWMGFFVFVGGVIRGIFVRFGLVRLCVFFFCVREGCVWMIIRIIRLFVFVIADIGLVSYFVSILRLNIF